MRPHPIRSLAGSALVASALLLAGCDSDSNVSGPDNEGDRTVQGFVTNDATAAKTAGDIEGAVVTAAEVNADGRFSAATGEAMTDASGRYVLETNANSDYMVVTAVKGDFESRVLVNAEGSGSTGAMTMTSETMAEADVYVESRRQNQDGVTAADVAAYVDAEVAARIEAGAESASRVAVAIGDAIRAEREYAEEEEGLEDEQLEDAEDQDEQSYRSYQSALSAKVSASAALAAKQQLESNVAGAYVSAGASASTQARASGAAKTAMKSFSASMDSATRFQLRKRAELMAAIASGNAIESRFRSENSSRTSLVAQASAQLVANLRAASSESQMEDAWADFRSQMKTQVAAELNISEAVVEIALGSAAVVEATLLASLLSATTVNAVVNAKATYYSGAKAAVQSALATSARAEFGAEVLVLASGN